MMWVHGLSFLLVSLGLSAMSTVAQASESVAAPKVGCPNIPVASLKRSIPFFTELLDFKREAPDDRADATKLAAGLPSGIRATSVHLTLGDECVDLTEYAVPGRAFPEDSRGNDLWFQHIAIVVSDMDKAYAKLREARVRFVSNVPQTLPDWNKSAAGISAFYFRDPDGHYLELIHFPPGKGQAKWQKPSSVLFLGIDHTAITVSDTAKSLAFYRDQLGLRVVGGSENYGIEQEHLSGVFNAHVLITSLRGGSGIGVEFLEYLSPTGGRRAPPARRINDLSHWQLPIEASGSSRMTEDPDGHLIKLVKQP